MYEKFYIHEKFLRTRNCRRRFIKNLLPEKYNENMETKQPRFKSRLKYMKQRKQPLRGFLQLQNMFDDTLTLKEILQKFLRTN